MADSKVTEKPLLEKIQDLLEREQGNYDVAFCVGKEKKIVRAVKIILKASSPFLEKKFEEKGKGAWTKKRGGILFPDFDPIAFELFVKITSLDTWSLETLKASNLPLNQILNLLSICRSFEMKKAEENLEILATIFLQSFGEYKDTDDFLQLSQTNLKYVLGSDEIAINELDVFYSAVRWADFQCRQMEVWPTEDQFREVLGECFFEIRFPVMTCAEFTKAQESKDILTREESLEIHRLIGLTGNENRKKIKFDSKKLPFKTTPRNKVQTSESRPNSDANSSETLIDPGTSRPCSTRGLESAKNPPIVCDGSRKPNLKIASTLVGKQIRRKINASKGVIAVHAHNVFKENGTPFSVVTLLDETQLVPQSLEYASSAQLPAAAAPLSKTIRWGKKIKGFPQRPAAVAVGNLIYSFGGGGDSDCDPRYYSLGVLDVFVLNVNEREKEWKKLSTEDSEVNPNQREGHSAVVHKEFVIIFGGYKTKKGQNSNSTYRLNTQTLKWDKPKNGKNIPGSRSRHSAVVLRNEMFIYGGRGDGVTNDLHSLHLESFRWSTIELNGIPRSIRKNDEGRFGHSAIVHNDRFILIFGGFDYHKKTRVNTIWSFDPHNKKWAAVETRGTPPSSRTDHRAFVHNGRMYIFGGSPYDGSYFNDVFSYDPETLEWKEVIPNGKAPTPRENAGCVALNDQVFIFGGSNEDKQYLDDTNVLQM